MKRILVTGAAGQIGSELVPALRARYGEGSVVASDIRRPEGALAGSGPFEATARTVRANGIQSRGGVPRRVRGPGTIFAAPAGTG